MTPEAVDPRHPDGARRPRPPRIDTSRRGRRWPIRRWLYSVATDLAAPVHEDDRHRIAADAIARHRDDLARRGQQAIHRLVRDGWWLGPAPYGYRKHRHTVTDPDGRTRTRHLLDPDWSRAPMVPLIYAWFLIEYMPIARIAARLAADPDRYPPPIDPISGHTRPWTVHAVRRVLTQPAYVGKTAWGRNRRGVRLGPEHWTWSRATSHMPLISWHAFYAAYFQIHGDHDAGTRRHVA